MSRIHPECPNSDPCDRSVTADVVLRQEPDEEDEEEDEGDGKKDDEDEDDDKDDGYSELNRSSSPGIGTKPLLRGLSSSGG
jgi:hypothetical protein